MVRRGPASRPRCIGAGRRGGAVGRTGVPGEGMSKNLGAPAEFGRRPLLASRAMFLRSIQIRGFKSFADKTVLEFIPGVSVIVGPNGSRKTNHVDAISWALGEQGARALRGGQMADVIFAGSPSRPALGMAEVKLVIDNTAGKIPVPMSEIEVSRTIYRSGDSEYRINGGVVRLLDVQELLSETGIGRALHTVVGQGQLEEVLLARPEERLDAVDGYVLEAADDRAGAARVLAEAEQVFRQTQYERAEAEKSFRSAVALESASREALASQAARTARLDAVDVELRRVEADLTCVLGELEVSERELDVAEGQFRAAGDRRREAEEIRRRIGEDAAGRRVEIGSLERSLASAGRERERLEQNLRDVRERISDSEAERNGLGSDIERLDG